MPEASQKLVQKRDDDDTAFKVTQKVDPAKLSCANARTYYEEWRLLEEQWYGSRVDMYVKKV